MQLPVNNEDLLNIKHEVNTTLLPEVLKSIQEISQDPSDPFLSVDKLKIKKIIAGLGAIGAIDKVQEITKQEYLSSIYAASDLVYSKENSLLDNQGIVVKKLKGSSYSSVDSLANFHLTLDRNSTYLLEPNDIELTNVSSKRNIESNLENKYLTENTKDNKNYWSTEELDTLVKLNFENATSFAKKYVAFDISDTSRKFTDGLNFSPVSVTVSEWADKLKGKTDWSSIWEEVGNDLLNLGNDALTVWLTASLTPVATSANTINTTISSTPYSKALNAYVNDKIANTDKFNNLVIKRLLSCGPDFFSNMFDVYIIPHSKTSFGITKDVADMQMKKLLEKAINNNSKLSEILTPDSFNVRTSNIEIPLPKLKTVEYKIGQRIVKVPSNRVSCDYRGTLELNIDSKLYYHSLITSLSLGRSLTEDVSNPVFTDIQKSTFKDFKNVITSNNIGIDMVILPLSYGTIDSSLYGQDRKSIVIYLSDVRFLGYGGGLMYTNTATQGKAKYPFIYKDIQILQNSLTSTTVASSTNV